MSERYSITASLWVNYDKNIVNFILKKGIELGFSYEIEDYATYEVIDQHKLLRKEAIVSLEEAFNYVLTAELPFLWINFKETKFDLGIQNINQTIYISFTGFGEGWKKISS